MNAQVVRNPKMPKVIHDSWAFLFNKVMDNPRWREIERVVGTNKHNICPEPQNIFKAFSIPRDKVQAVFLGLSPYQNYKRGMLFATGLAFGVPDRTMDTPSLQIIRDELERTYPTFNVDDPRIFDYTLEHWHNQGVMLLNSALTVIKRADARCHLHLWDWFTQEVLWYISYNTAPKPFVFMGRDAQKFNKHVDDSLHTIINVYHPAAEARNKGGQYRFTGSDVFTKVNNVLINLYNEKINWLYEN